MDEEKRRREMAEIAFFKGETAFCNGRYQETVTQLTRCLKIEKNCENKYFEIEANNILGMLFYFTGYETVALDHYLSAYESAKKNGRSDGQISSLLNIGLLYQGQKEYDRAMEYYKRAKRVAENDLYGFNMMYALYANIQIAQLYCKRGNYDRAQKISCEAEKYYFTVPDGEFFLPRCLLEVHLAEYEKQEDKVEKLVNEAIQCLERDSQFMEQIDFYVELCELLYEKEYKEQTRELLDVLHEKLRPTEFLNLRLRMERMEVDYEKKYGTTKSYLQACKEFMILYQEYEDILQKFRKQNLGNIVNLQKLEVKKNELEKRSKCDLVTGLLNKKAFRQEVEKYLSEHSGQSIEVLAFVDVDDFKLVNDRYGHLLGDKVMVKLAEMIRDDFGKDCICGRFGGDEFTIFAKNVQDISEMEKRIENFRRKFEGVGFGKNEDYNFTLSIGVSFNRNMKVSYQALLSCADEALEKAKEYGKNRVTLYEMKKRITQV